MTFEDQVTEELHRCPHCSCILHRGNIPKGKFIYFCPNMECKKPVSVCSKCLILMLPQSNGKIEFSSCPKCYEEIWPGNACPKCKEDRIDPHTLKCKKCSHSISM